MTILSIIVTLLIFTLIVVVHEFGHFIVARQNDILVEEFAIGMGPMVYGKKKGDTLYSIRLFPIGGFCKMLGEEGEEDDPRSFTSKKVWQRIVVCLAGVVMNFLLAVVLGCILISVTGLRTTTIKEVLDGTPAQEAGLQPGDRILKINGKRLYAYEYIGHYLRLAGPNPTEVVFMRDGSRVSLLLTPYAVQNEGGGVSYLMGIVAESKAGLFSEYGEGIPVAGPIETVKQAFGQSMYYVSLVVDGLGQMIRRQVDLNDLAGPIGVGQMVDSNLQAAAQTETAVKSSMIFIMSMAMLLSANLAVMNLLPIPALDGGRIVFLIIEGIRRRPMDPEKEGWIHLAGFALVMILAIVVAFNDVLRIL